MKSTSNLVFPTAMLALLAACGGGGGDAPPLGTSVAITSANQNAVARSTIAGGYSVAVVGVAGDDGRAAAQSATRVGTTTAAGTLDRLVRQSLALLTNGRRTAASAGVHAAATSTSSGACDLGGTYNFTYDDHDGSGSLSAGDIATYVYSHCVQTSGTIDGSMIMTMGSGASAAAPSGVTAFQHLTATDGSTSSGFNGSVAFSETTDGVGTTDTLTVGNSGLTVSLATTGYSDTITYISGLRIVAWASSDAGAAETSIDGSFSSTALGGRVTVATVAPLAISSTSDYPASGQLRMTGASGSLLQVTVANGAQVELQLDADGNGVYESDVLVGWSALLPQ